MLVKVNDLVKRYGDVLALDHLSLSINDGEIYGLLGPNGSGKTTAINCILSLLKFDQGDIEIFGKPMTPEANDIKRNIGVVMQDIGVFNELTVFENIDYFCGLYVPNKKLRRQLVEEAIQFVGLEDYRKFYPKKLSGGLLRRLNIACGIAHQPKLIIMDEPTVAVDPQSRNKILEGIVDLNKRGATVIYTSHYMEEVEQICSQITIIDEGKVVASGTKENLKSMIALGEKVTVEAYGVTQDQVKAIWQLPNVSAVSYEDDVLKVKSTKGVNLLEQVLDLMKQEKITYGKIYGELPTLNDVFLEITGKELRD